MTPVQSSLATAIPDSGDRSRPTPILALLAALFLVAGSELPNQRCSAVDSSFRRGDTNFDGSRDIADIITNLTYLFSGNGSTLCLDALDIDDDGVVDLADPITLIGLVFGGGDPLAAPFETCGIDLTPDALDCIGPIASCPLLLPPTADFLHSDDATEATTGVFLFPQPHPADVFEFAGRSLGMRPLLIDLDPSITVGSARIETESDAVAIYLLDGTSLPLPIEFTEAELPLSVLVNVDAPIETVLTITSTASGATDEIRIISGPATGLAGMTLAEAPFFRYQRAIPDSEPEVALAIDPLRFSDRIGETFNVHIVPHRTAEEWGIDASLNDVTAIVETVTLSGISVLDGIIAAWSAPLDPGTFVSAGYDVVLDFDQNGFLDPGDVIDGLADEPAFSVVKQLSNPGPLAVQTSQYSGGGFLAQRTYYPTTIATLGELPLVIISHGNGHQYTWYDYIGTHLASHGYIVVSHANNTMPGIEAAAGTTLSNTEFFLGSLPSILGGALDGHVDSTRIAWIGHSRGGEGVVRAYDRIIDGTFTPTNFTAESIRVVSSIAPTVFLGVVSADPHEVPYHLIAGSADGDVTGGVDCPICQFFRITQRGTGPIHVTYVQGSSHNDFNCCGVFDGVGPSQIGESATQLIARSYFLALVETYLKDNRATIEYFERSPTELLPSSAMASYTIATQFEPAILDDRLVIDDFQETPTDIGVSSSGWIVQTDLQGPLERLHRDLNSVLTHTPSDPTNGMTQTGASAAETERGLLLEWPNSTTGSYAWVVPDSAENWRGYETLSLRTCQITRHPNTNSLNGPLDFTITLVDGLGNSSSLSTAEYAEITRPYPRSGLGGGVGWSNEFNTIRIALVDFLAESDLDLSDVATLRLDFGSGFGSPLGKIGIDDVQLVR